jgi:hypothetical protein
MARQVAGVAPQRRAERGDGRVDLVHVHERHAHVVVQLGMIDAAGRGSPIFPQGGVRPPAHAQALTQPVTRSRETRTRRQSTLVATDRDVVLAAALMHVTEAEPARCRIAAGLDLAAERGFRAVEAGEQQAAQLQGDGVLRIARQKPPVARPRIVDAPLPVSHGRLTQGFRQTLHRIRPARCVRVRHYQGPPYTLAAAAVKPGRCRRPLCRSRHQYLNLRSRISRS